MRIWAPTFLTASNPNALRVITSIASKSLVIRSYSNLTSPSDRNFQGRLGRDLHPQAVEHARRTKVKAALSGCLLLHSNSGCYRAAGLRRTGGFFLTGAGAAAFSSRPLSMTIMNGLGA